MNNFLYVVLFVAMSITVSAFVHKFCKYYLLSVIISTAVITLAYQAFNYVLAGYLDPFFAIAMIFTGVYAAFISSLVGIPFAYLRRNK